MVEVGQFEMEITPLSGSILDGRQQYTFIIVTINNHKEHQAS